MKFDLSTPLALRMHMASGDYVEFHTTEDNIEATMINLGTQDDSVHVVEIF